jgi:uncharacterized membrane protein
MSEEQANSSDLRQFAERLDYLEAQLHRQTARIYELESRLGVGHPARHVPHLESSETPKPSSQQKRVDLSRMAQIDWERVVGGNWFNRIGILAIILAVGFFFKHAIENEWLGPLGRVTLGVVTGFSFLIGSELIRKRGYQFYAHGLAGGGICILYLSIYAAHDLYQLIPQIVAALLMALVTIIAATLAVRSDALAIAILGLICGFLTPVLLAGQEDSQIVLFGYLTFLNLGVLGIAWIRRWRVLSYLAFVATCLLSQAWWDEWYRPEKLASTLVVFTILFLIFALTGIIGNLTRKEPAHELDLLLILLNGGIYFSALYELLESAHLTALSGATVLLAIFYLAQATATHRWGGEDRYLPLALLGLALTFVTLTIPIRFNLSWVTIGWAVEGGVLTWLGLRTSRRLTRLAAAIVLGLAILHWFQIDLTGLSPVAGESFLPVLNRRGMSIFTVIVALFVSAMLYRRLGAAPTHQVSRERSLWSGGMALVAALLVVAWISFDQWDYYRLLIDPLRERGDSLPAIKRLQNWSNLFLGSWWAFSGMSILVAGIRRQSLAARLPGLSLLILSGLIVIVSGLRFHGEEWHTALVNPTFGLFLFFALMVAIAYREYRHKGESDVPGEVSMVSRLLLSFGNLSLLMGLSLELDGFFGRHQEFGRDGLIEQLGQSMLYAVYGALLIAAGAWRANRQLRLLGLSILAMTTLKVFLFDLSALEQIYRVASFVVLGLILLLVSWHYQRRSGREETRRESSAGEP